MQENYQTTKAAGLGQNVGIGYPPNASWSNPNNITLDDGSSATIGFFEGAQQGDALIASLFDFNLPSAAVIDGISLYVDGSQTGSMGSIAISPTGTSSKDLGTLSGNYGGSTDLWGADEITLSDLDALTVQFNTGDVSGGDGIAAVDYIEVTVFWHIDLDTTPTDVPNRVIHKVYSREGDYLGELPNVSSPLGFVQDINTAGSALTINCGVYADNDTTTEPLLTDDDEEILTDNDLPILADITQIVIARGNSTDSAIFKNSNRIKSYIYNYWHPNGKLVFSGQVNKVTFGYGSGDSYVQLMVFSDGLDLSNFIARGYPFDYTTDVSQTTQDGYATVRQGSGKSLEWVRYGQTFTTGGAVDNLGAIVLMLEGNATVTLSIADAPNGNLIGSITKTVSAVGATAVQFDLPQLLAVSASTQYFVGVSVAQGQTIRLYRNSANVYADGQRYESTYSGGSGGGSYIATAGDLYIITKYGDPTTTTTYTDEDPITGMMRGILLDYNARGGYIQERDFTAAGYTLTRIFNMDSVYDALNKTLELAPAGYYYFVDLGTAEIDILPTSATADYTVVRGKDVNKLDLSISIEQVKNYLLFTGGETGGDNLFREYQDAESASLYGLRTAAKSDNRVIQTATADAIGETFIEENSGEVQDTTVTILNSAIDITLLRPGKTLGFRNFGVFIDETVLQIVRREINLSDGTTTLTLGRLPVTMNAEIQRINRELLEEQTSNNPAAPS